MEKSEHFKVKASELISWKNRALESLKLGELDLKHGYYWSVISQSYYAAFYIVKALLLSKGKITKSHGGTFSEFHRLFIKEGSIDKELGTWYSDALKNRSEADYSVIVEWTQNEAEDALEKAREFVETVKKLIPDNKFINSNKS